MTLDGQPYASGSFVFPASYNSASSLNGVALSTTLSNLYFLTRQQGRMVFQVAYGWNGQTPAINSAVAGYSCIAVVHSQVAHAYARIPLEATHLVAFVTFGAQPLGEATVEHRITIGANVGANVTFPIRATSADNALEAGQAALAIVGLNAPNWAASNSAVYVASCDVHLSGLDLSIDREIIVEGCVTGDVPVPYRPWFVSCFWEVR